MANLGWTGILVPESHGGSGLGLAAATVVARGLAAGILPEPFTAVAVLASTVIIEGDNPTLQSDLLSRVVSGTLLATVAWQEHALTLSPRELTTRAVLQGSTITLSGTKRFIAGAAAADGFIVSALGPTGLELYWVLRSASGVNVSLELLADGTFSGTLTLHDVQLDASARLASVATATGALEKGLDHATIAAGAELLGIAESALELTLDYLRTRKQFGRAIGSFQGLQHRAVDMHVQQALASSVLDEVLASSALMATGDERAAAASRVKARCNAAALYITREAIQMHGAMGYTDDCDVGLYAKRALVLASWLGSAQQHRRRFAQSAPLNAEDRPRRQTVVATNLSGLPRNADWNTISDEDFRNLVRGFIEEHYPEGLRYLPRRARWHEIRDWTTTLAQRGWLAPAWPRAWGGMELSPAKQIIYMDEFERWGVARAPDQGVRQLGPVLMQYGTEAQQRRYLPHILSCEHVWCQGYSEPNAGSDLASLTTSAVRDGDTFVINGQKIWTTLAMDATHIYILCRTDATVKKQLGISFIIADINTPGITVRPIRDITGNEEFCQVFLDNVRVPAENLVGALNQGWTVAKAMLDFERLGIGSPRRPLIAFNRLARFATRSGLFADSGFVDRFTRLRLDLADHASLYGQFADRARRGQSLGAAVSMLKIWGMETFQRITEFSLEAAGAYGAAAGSINIDGDDIDLLAPFYMARLITIGGGSNEIQRNIMAKQVLNLPG